MPTDSIVDSCGKLMKQLEELHKALMGSQRNVMLNEGRRFADIMFKFYDPDMMMMPALRGMREAREAMMPPSSERPASRAVSAAE